MYSDEKNKNKHSICIVDTYNGINHNVTATYLIITDKPATYRKRNLKSQLDFLSFAPRDMVRQCYSILHLSITARSYLHPRSF